MNYNTDIAKCPKCNKVPEVVTKFATPLSIPDGTTYFLDTYRIRCCGLDSLESISKSHTILNWNLKALAQ